MKQKTLFITIISILVFSLILVITAATLTLHKDFKTLRYYLGQNAEQIDVLQDEVSGFKGSISNLTLSLFEDPNGVRFVQSKYGVSNEDLVFIKNQRGALIEPEEFVENQQLISVIRDKFDIQYSKNKKLFDGIKLSDRGKFIANAVTRVNGSISTYAVKSRYSYKLKDALTIHNGNCSDYTLRLMLVLEALGLKSAMISSVTSNLPGHVFVDAYDPFDDSSYFLDSTWNIMIKIPETEGKSFFQFLFELPMPERVEFIKNLKFIQFPMYFRYIDPGLGGLTGSPYSLEFLNGQRDGLVDQFRRFLISDLDQLKAWWKSTPSHQPFSLDEIREMNLAEIPEYFNLSKKYAHQIRQSAVKSTLAQDSQEITK